MKRFLLLITICISSVSFGQVPNYVPTNGLFGWWGFNGNANDESGNANNGTVNGATLTTDRFGNAGSAYDFDGVDDDISVARSNLNSFSVSSWVKLNSAACFSSIIDAYEKSWEFLTDCNNGSNLSVAVWTGISSPQYIIYSSGFNLQSQLWAHVVCTYEMNQMSIYANGNLINSFNTINIPISNGTYYFGRSRSGSDSFIDGSLDDIGIWNRALTQCEIQDLYNAQLNSSNGVNAGIDQIVCEGNSVTLSGSGGINYQWNNNVIDGVSFTPIATQDYILTGEDVNGCIGTDTVTVEVLSNSTSSETVTECDSYTWSTNGQTYTQSGQYTDVLTNTAGCDSTVTLDLTITSVNNNISQVDDITLQTDVMNAQYQWVDCDEDFQPIIGETGQVFVANANGNYAVVVSENNCSDTSACITISKVGLDDKNKNIFNVYPNPTSNSFTISSEKVINSEFKIIDSQGREVLTGSMNGQEHTIEISNLSKGVYSVVFNNTEYPVVSVIKE
jgi:hypothetical protein